MGWKIQIQLGYGRVKIYVNLAPFCFTDRQTDRRSERAKQREINQNHSPIESAASLAET